MQRDDMTSWWVFHGVTFEHERTGGFLWAPSSTREGSRKPDWLAVGDVRRGDLIYSCRDRILTHVLLAVGDGEVRSRPSAPYPQPEGATAEGHRVSADYFELPRPRLAVDKIVRDQFEAFSGPSGPLDRNGNGNMGYLYRLGAVAASYLHRQCLRGVAPEFDARRERLQKG